MKQLIPLSVVVFVLCLLHWNNNVYGCNRHEVTRTDYEEIQPKLISGEIQVEKTINDNDVIDCIAHVEGYSSAPYYCGTWAVGYGTTMYADGSSVTPEGRHLTRLEARHCVYVHLTDIVYPAIKKSVKRKLSYGEYVACCMYITNVGVANFQKSDFLYALNNNYSTLECVNLLIKSKSSSSSGIKKRRWLEGAIFCGHITPSDLRQLPESSVYNYKVSDFYENGVPKYNQHVISQFLRCRI